MDLFNLNSEWMIEETKVEKQHKKYPFYDAEFSGKLIGKFHQDMTYVKSGVAFPKEPCAKTRKVFIF